MIKRLPDGRMMVEFNVTEEQHEKLIAAMCAAGAPDVSAFIHWLVMNDAATTNGKPALPMPWKEERTPALPVHPWHGALYTPMQACSMPYSPARRYDATVDSMRDRLRQMVAVKRQIELELINFAEKELMRE